MIVPERKASNLKQFSCKCSMEMFLGSKKLRNSITKAPMHWKWKPSQEPQHADKNKNRFFSISDFLQSNLESKECMQLIISRKNSQDSKVLFWILVFVFLKKESDYIFRSMANSNKQKKVHHVVILYKVLSCYAINF